MNKKTMLLALAAVSAAMFALPALASAGTWHMEPPSDFTIAGGAVTLKTTSGAVTSCTSSLGTGSYDAGSSTTGKISITFHGCTGTFGSHCTTVGQPTGTIAAGPLPFHNILLEPKAGGGGAKEAGILVTPLGVDNNPTAGDGFFTSFVCLGATLNVRGNGVIGTVEQPCGTKTKKVDIDFTESQAGHQKWTQITTSGTIYDLKAVAASHQTASLVTTLTETAAQEGTINCT